MSDVSDVSSVNAQSILDSINAKTNTKQEDDKKTDFLTLLVAQLENQDPLNPQDGSEFMSQLAQLEQVQGIQDLNESFSSFSQSMLSNQALQATTLVGRDVMVQSSVGQLEQGKALTGVIGLPEAASSVTLNVFNSAGALVRQLPLGDHGAGPLAFSWDGLGGEGLSVPSGQYTLAAQGSVNGESVELGTAVNFNVNSVTIDPKSGTMLNLAGLDSTVALADVLQVR
jgi:flagellar basal-body rod modification protein FlgD